MAASQAVDLQGIAELYGKDFFKRKAASRKEKKLIENDQIGVEVDWRRVRFMHDEPLYDPVPPRPGTGMPINNCLFHTTYANKTKEPQTYNFKAERTTRSSCTVELEQSFTQGYEMAVNLKTPCEVLEANAGFHRELTLTNLSGQTIEEEMAWGVNSDITVEGGHQAIAKMIITEEEYDGKFTMKTSAKGIVRLIFHNLKPVAPTVWTRVKDWAAYLTSCSGLESAPKYNLQENNAFIRSAELDIHDLMTWARDQHILPKGDTVSFDGPNKCVVLTTKGKCLFKYGLRQDVEVDQVQL